MLLTLHQSTVYHIGIRECHIMPEVFQYVTLRQCTKWIIDDAQMIIVGTHSDQPRAMSINEVKLVLHLFVMFFVSFIVFLYSF